MHKLFIAGYFKCHFKFNFHSHRNSINVLCEKKEEEKKTTYTQFAEIQGN